jgi:zinc protease
MSNETEAGGAQLTDGVQRRTLSNGLTVVVKENHDSEVAAIVTYVKAGYFNEVDEIAGISHVVEHMYFNGTPTRPGAEDISRATKAIGGRLNAGTIYDRTSYYVVLPSEHWVEGLEVQADAFQNPLFDAEILSKEMEAILQEARRKLDNPSAYGREKMYELAFQKHRMRRWRIGEEDILRTLDRDALQSYYEDHYRPGNTVLCIVGDVDAEEAFAEVERLYGAHERGHLRKRTGPAEPQQKEFRYRRMTGEVSRNYCFLGFHTPGEGHKDNAALDVLATILGSGRSSRLNAALKEEKGVVTGISANVYQFDDIGLFDVSSTSTVEDLDRSMREIFVEIERVKLLGVSESEMDRARGILRTSEAMGLEEVLGQASTLVAYEAQGDFHLFDEEVAALRAVTAADVQRVARKYLNFDNANLLEYGPVHLATPDDAVTRRAHLEGAVLAEVARMQEPELHELAPSVLTREELGSWSRRFAEPDRTSSGVSRFEIPGGVTLVVKENHSVPTVSMGAFFRGGRIDESSNRAGLTRMLQRVMVKQTQNRSSDELSREIEALGSSLGRSSQDDFFGFSLGGLAENLPYAMDILVDVLRNPKITDAQVNREREMQFDAVSGIEDSSSSLAYQLLRSSIFQEHPYGHPELGSIAVLRSVNAQRLERHYEEVIRPETLVLCVVGDVNADAVQELVTQYFGDWSPLGESQPATAAEFYDRQRLETPPALFADRDGTVQKDRAQTFMMLAQPTVARGDADEEAFDVLQSITGGLGGSFFEEIRSKRGLAYQVSTFAVNNIQAGYFGTLVACSPDSAAVVRSLVLELTSHLAVQPPSAESIQRAQNYLAGSHVIGNQRNAAQMSDLIQLELLGMDLSEVDRYVERVRAVTAEDLQRVAAQYLSDKPYASGQVSGMAGRDANPGS